MRRETAEGGSPEPFPGAAVAKRSYAASLISGCLYVPCCIIGRQLPGAVKNRQRTVLIAMHTHFGLDVVAAVPVAGYLQRKAFETHAVVFADGALELLAQDVVQAVRPGKARMPSRLPAAVARIRR